MRPVRRAAEFLMNIHQAQPRIRARAQSPLPQLRPRSLCPRSHRRIVAQRALRITRSHFVRIGCGARRWSGDGGPRHGLRSVTPDWINAKWQRGVEVPLTTIKQRPRLSIILQWAYLPPSRCNSTEVEWAPARELSTIPACLFPVGDLLPSHSSLQLSSPATSKL